MVQVTGMMWVLINIYIPFPPLLMLFTDNIAKGLNGCLNAILKIGGIQDFLSESRI